MKKIQFISLLILMLVFTFVLTGCDNGGGGGDPEPELADWTGTWNSYFMYYDEQEIVAILNARYEATPAYQTRFDTLEKFITFVASVVRTDFGSFVIQGNKITFYEQKADAKNPSGKVLETVTYTYKGRRSDTHSDPGGGTEDFEWYAFEGDKAGDYKYLLIEGEAERDTPDGPVHFHMRYGSKSFDDLLYTPKDNYGNWSPTIISYDTTIAELIVFMSGD
ncbi:MAG: ZinT/AdcA family metal-binding protein [Prevotellaceae bacterium]|jgi:Zn/Cd-binding protein ZinT|nr:ZinT/AdcA family metal-binding protein [Prevotellaceae bacterium]